MLGLLGPNGAGKSTTVNLAVGLLAPDEGRVVIEGAGNPRDPAVRARLGVAPQALALYDMLTGEENLRFFGEVYGLSGSRLARARALGLDFVGLTDRARDRVAHLLGRHEAALNLAAALVHDPQLILLDEPTVGVDPQSRNQIFDNILALKQLGRTLIYTTHYMEEAERLCDRVAIVDKGRLLALGTVSRAAGDARRPRHARRADRSRRGAHRDRRSAGRAQSPGGDRDRQLVSHGARHARTGVPAPDRAQPEGLMKSILALAGKDLRLLVRVKSGLFFTFVWPIIVAILFGFVFSGQSAIATRACASSSWTRTTATGRARSSRRSKSSGDFTVDRATRAEAEIDGPTRRSARRSSC